MDRGKHAGNQEEWSIIPGPLLPAWVLISAIMLFPGSSQAGPYSESAHGDGTTGVERTSITDYSTGNCVHCHEQHSSIEGSEPGPVSGSPSTFALFADNFDDSAQTNPYSTSDNFCFNCHVSAGSLQSGGGITNNQYSYTFGGYDTIIASDILQAFNLNGYHNLYDIKNFAETTFDFFTADSNPCAACHNPHRARRNKENITDPSYSAISRPTDHDALWGDDAGELMSDYSSSYRAPYDYGSDNTTHEPGGTATKDGSNMPDYNSFCLDCHQYEVPVTTPGVVSMNPNTSAGHLTAIDWSAAGDMHGDRPRVWNVDGENGGGDFQGFGTITAPYNKAPVESNYVLSCIDCHEPHGSVLLTLTRGTNYLLRKVVNNNRVSGCGAANEVSWCEINFCLSCHTWSHCGGPQGCLGCHYHGAENEFCGPWTDHNF